MSFSRPLLVGILSACLPCCAGPQAQEPARAEPREASELDVLVAEMVHASDVRYYAVSAVQPPPRAFVPFAANAAAPPPFEKVVAYVVNFDKGFKRGIAPFDSGCRAAVASDGTLCPSVVLPGVELTAAQARILKRLARSEPAVPKVSSCVSKPHHTFVFYSRTGVPVYEWSMDLRCGRSSSSRWVLENATRTALADLCRELGLALCFMQDAGARERASEAFVSRYMEALPGGSKRLKPFPMGLRPDQQLQHLSVRDQRQLCAWSIQHSSSALEAGGDARSNEAGARTRLLGLSECTREFPRCAVPLATVLPCMDALQRGAPVLAPFPNGACTEQRECLWGFEFTEPHARGSSPNSSDR